MRSRSVEIAQDTVAYRTLVLEELTDINRRLQQSEQDHRDISTAEGRLEERVSRLENDVAEVKQATNAIAPIETALHTHLEQAKLSWQAKLTISVALLTSLFTLLKDLIIH